MNAFLAKLSKTTAFRFVAVCFMYMIVHYTAPYLYIQFCTPKTMIGFITSPFIVPAPHCKAIRWTIMYSASNIETMWVVIGVWIMTRLVNFENVFEDKKIEKVNVADEE